MPDVKDSVAHYHVVNEGLENTDATTNHLKITNVARSFTTAAAHVSGPLSPGLWEITFYCLTGISGGINFAHGATSAAATPTKTTSAFVPTVGIAANAVPVTLPFKVIIPEGLPYIGFISTAAITITYSVRRLRGI